MSRPSLLGFSPPQQPEGVPYSGGSAVPRKECIEFEYNDLGRDIAELAGISWKQIV